MSSVVNKKETGHATNMGQSRLASSRSGLGGQKRHLNSWRLQNALCVSACVARDVMIENKPPFCFKRVDRARVLHTQNEQLRASPGEILVPNENRTMTFCGLATAILEDCWYHVHHMLKDNSLLYQHTGQFRHC